MEVVLLLIVFLGLISENKESGLKRFKLAKKAFKVLHTADEENQLLWVKGLSLMFGDRTTLKASEMECYVAAGLIPCLVKLCISPFPYIPYYALNTLVSLSTCLFFLFLPPVLSLQPIISINTTTI